MYTLIPHICCHRISGLVSRCQPHTGSAGLPRVVPVGGVHTSCRGFTLGWAEDWAETRLHCDRQAVRLYSSSEFEPCARLVTIYSPLRRFTQWNSFLYKWCSLSAIKQLHNNISTCLLWGIFLPLVIDNHIALTNPSTALGVPCQGIR